MGEPTERRFLIVVGEASGDRHAARVVAALKALGRARAVGVRVRGVAGPRLVAEGVERIVDVSALAVIGFSGVLRRLPRILAAERAVLREARAFAPHAALLVDTPGFNFRVGPALRRLGVPVFSYIAPQVWAWHAERARTMARWVDRLAVVFPFEEPLFRAAGVNARFLGHPLLDGLAPERDEAGFRAELEVPPGARLLGLLPGSREQEVRSHAPAMLGAAAILARERPDLVPVVALADGLDFERLAAGAPRPAGLRVVRGRTHAVQAWSRACAVASGTATLETALFGTPMAIVYRTGRLNYEIARRVVRLDRIGLPNIVASSAAVPELVQDDLTPPKLAAALASFLDDEGRHRAAREALGAVRAALGEPGASARVAAWLWELAA